MGCSTAKPVSDYSGNMSLKISRLEQKAEENDKYISELKYEINKLSNQIERLESASYYEDSDAWDTSANETAASKSGPGDTSRASSELPDRQDRIIRVRTSVRDVQKALNRAGYYEDAIDGKMGRKTKQAIRDFQAAHDLKVDGIVGRRTWAKMRNYL